MPAPTSSSTDRTSIAELCLPLLVAVCLMLPLFPIPGPAFLSGHPWKVELFSALLMLCLIAVFSIRGGVAFQKLFEIKGRNFTAICLALGAFVVWSAVSAGWARSSNSVAHHTLLWALYLIIFVAVSNLVRYENGRKLILSTLATTAFLITALCLIDYLTMQDFSSAEGTLRIRYGKYAELLVTAAPVLFAASLCLKDRRKAAVYVAAGAAAWLTVMLSLSRGAFLSGIAGFGLMFAAVAIFSPRSFRRKTLVCAAAWVIFTVGIQAFFMLGSSVPSTTDYITGKADPTRENASMRVFTWTIARRMIAEKVVTGVGADNFGIDFNAARAEYAMHEPADPRLSAAEDFVVERAHNEPLQITAELGIPGLLLFLTAFGVFAYWVIKHFLAHRRAVSPILAGASAGITAFFISSMASSFSFRAAQNGIVLFLVLAPAVSYLQERGSRTSRRPSASSLSPRVINALALVVLAVAAVFFATNGMSIYYQYRSEHADDISEKSRLFESSISWNAENAGSYFSYSMALAARRESDPAAFALRRAIDLGLGTTPVYSLLARIYEDAGQFGPAEQTMAEAVDIFPRSVFARTRYALLLMKNGKAAQADRQFAIASDIDNRQAAGWRSIIEHGSTATELKSLRDHDTAAPSELRPVTAVLQYADPTEEHQP